MFGKLGTFKIGEIEVEIEKVLQIVVIIVVTILLTAVIRILMNRFIARSSTYLKIDKTRYKFFRSALNWTIYILAIIAIIHSIPPLRSISMTLLTGAGIMAAVIGFASQQAISNIIGGVFVVLSRPFRVGDVIRVGRDGSAANEMMGTVEDITLRHTVIRDFQNRRIIIPNSVINNEVILNNNIVDERYKRYFQVSIAYSADISKAMRVIQEEVRKHPYFMDGRTPEEKRLQMDDVPVRVIQLQDSGILLRAYVWSPNFDQSWELFCHLNKVIVERFREENIEIPFPYRVVINK